MTETNGHKPAPILDLDALAEPSGYFLLGGKRYGYTPWDRFGLLDQKRLGITWSRILELEAPGEITPEQEQEHDAGVRSMIGDASSMTREEAAAADIEKLGTALAGFFVMRSNAIDVTSAALVAFSLGNSEPSTGENSSPASTATGRKATRSRG